MKESVSATVITIYKNGDRHFPGKKVVVNQKVIRNFDTFLDRVTRDTCSAVAIRKIYTPTHGTYVRPRLGNLIHGATYVAAGPEPFRPTSYGYAGILPPMRTSLLKVKPQVRKVVSSRFKKEATAAPLKNRIIFVSRNGQVDVKPAKLLLDKGILISMDSILQYISTRLKLTTGSVGSLYSIEGTKIRRVRQLISNTNYVAVGSGKTFIPADYLNDEALLTTTIPRCIKLHKKYRGKFVGLTKQRRVKKEFELPYYVPYGKEYVLSTGNKVLPPIHLGKDVDNDELEQPRKWEVSTTYLPGDGDILQSEDNNVTEEPIAQPGTRNVTPSTPPVHITEQESHVEEEGSEEISVFKATGNQKETGDEVKDDKRTRVEKTIDMLPAATVVEEIADDTNEKTEP